MKERLLIVQRREELLDYLRLDWLDVAVCSFRALIPLELEKLHELAHHSSVFGIHIRQLFRNQLLDVCWFGLGRGWLRPRDFVAEKVVDGDMEEIRQPYQHLIVWKTLFSLPFTDCLLSYVDKASWDS